MVPAASELIFSRSSKISTSRFKHWLMASNRRYRLRSVSIFCCSSKSTLSCEAMKSALWDISERASKASPTSLGTLGASATAFLNWPNILRARASSSVLCSMSDVIFSICAMGKGCDCNTSTSASRAMPCTSTCMRPSGISADRAM